MVGLGASVEDDKSHIEAKKESTTDGPKECNVIPVRPLRLLPKLVLTLTEVPFLILWSYAVYWIEVCVLVGGKAPLTVWWSAAVAGLLVGLGLNANAYRALRRPMSRSRKKRQERKRELLLETKRLPDAASLLQRLSEIIDLMPSPRYLNTSYLGHTTTSDSPDEPYVDFDLEDKPTLRKGRMVSPDSSYPMCWSD